MAVKTLQILVCAVSLISLQGCFVSHSSTVRDTTPATTQTTTVYHAPSDDTVVTTTH